MKALVSSAIPIPAAAVTARLLSWPVRVPSPPEVALLAARSSPFTSP